MVYFNAVKGKNNNLQLTMYLWKNAFLFIINLKTLQQSFNFMPWKPI